MQLKLENVFENKVSKKKREKFKDEYDKKFHEFSKKQYKHHLLQI